MQETKKKASQINEPDDLWDLEQYLTDRRLGRLLYENRLGEEELRGLREEKMKSIRSFAQFLGDDAS